MEYTQTPTALCNILNLTKKTSNKKGTYDISVDLKNQGKYIALNKFPVYMGMKINEVVDKAAKEAIGMSEKSTTKLSYADYYLAIRRDKNPIWQKKLGTSTSKLHNIKHVLKCGKAPTTATGNMKSN